MEKMPLEPAPVLVVKSIFQKIDLNIKRRVLITKEATIKTTTIKKDKDKKAVTKKEIIVHMLKNKAWEANHKVVKTYRTSSLISKIFRIWINLKFKNYL